VLVVNQHPRGLAGESGGSKYKRRGIAQPGADAKGRSEAEDCNGARRARSEVWGHRLCARGAEPLSVLLTVTLPFGEVMVYLFWVHSLARLEVWVVGIGKGWAVRICTKSGQLPDKPSPGIYLQRDELTNQQ
jgi:hypothetical protein